MGEDDAPGPAWPPKPYGSRIEALLNIPGALIVAGLFELFREMAIGWLPPFTAGMAIVTGAVLYRARQLDLRDREIGVQVYLSEIDEEITERSPEIGPAMAYVATLRAINKAPRPAHLAFTLELVGPKGPRQYAFYTTERWSDDASDWVASDKRLRPYETALFRLSIERLRDREYDLSRSAVLAHDIIVCDDSVRVGLRDTVDLPLHPRPSTSLSRGFQIW